jgi:hypothetical protein
MPWARTPAVTRREADDRRAAQLNAWEADDRRATEYATTATGAAAGDGDADGDG